jgi:hypothetical protein
VDSFAPIKPMASARLPPSKFQMWLQSACTRVV